MDEGVEEVPLGLYLVKGDMMYGFNISLFRVCDEYLLTIEL
jgi:hypothetical protein